MALQYYNSILYQSLILLPSGYKFSGRRRPEVLSRFVEQLVKKIAEIRGVDPDALLEPEPTQRLGYRGSREIWSHPFLAGFQGIDAPRPEWREVPTPGDGENEGDDGTYDSVSSF